MAQFYSIALLSRSSAAPAPGSRGFFNTIGFFSAPPRLWGEMHSVFEARLTLGSAEIEACRSSLQPLGFPVY